MTRQSKISSYLTGIPALLLTVFISQGMLFGDQKTVPVTQPLSSLNESFIALQVNSKAGDLYYRVMMDEEENPYLDLKAYSKSWLGLTVNCDLKIKKCNLRIPANEDPHIIDIGNHLFTEGGPPRPFSPDNVFILEDRVWIRYDLLLNWLPINGSWNLDEYLLRLYPDFLLPKKLKTFRKKQRTKDQQRKKTRDWLENTTPIKPEGEFRSELRYRLSHFHSQSTLNENDVRNISTLSADYGADILKGWLRITGSLNNDYEGNQNADHTWKYHRTDQKYFQLLELGHLFFPSSLLIPGQSIKQGVHIKRKETLSGFGNMEWVDMTLPGTEVDLYINGFLISSQIADGSGRYEFKGIPARGGDQISLRFLSPEGISHKKDLKVISAEGKILSDRDWDIDLYYGTNDDQDSKAITRVATFSYGLLNNLTILLNQYDLNNIFVKGSQTIWRPFYGLHLTLEHITDDATDGRALKVYLSYFSSQYIQLEMREFNETGALTNLQSGDKKALLYSRYTHFINFNRWNIEGNFTETESVVEKQLKSRFRLSREFSMNVANENRFLKSSETETDQWTLEGRYDSVRQNISMKRVFESSLTLTYNFKERDSPWRYFVNYNQSDEGENNYSIGISWRPSSTVNASTVGGKSSQSASLSWTGILSEESGPESPEHFGTGTLRGNLSALEKEKNRPISEAEIFAGRFKGVSDASGDYVIHGITPHQKLKVWLNPRSIDINLVPKVEKLVMQFRPGSVIDYNPEVVKTVGLDGYVESNFSIPQGTFIQALNLSEGNVYGPIVVEDDGFFMFEGLKSGTYRLDIRGTPQPPKSLELIIEEDQEWISDLVIPWNR